MNVSAVAGGKMQPDPAGIAGQPAPSCEENRRLCHERGK